jgi:hypothetical protein
VTTQTQRLPVRREGVILQDEDTRSVLLDGNSGTTYVLNPTARAIWELCDGNTTSDELVAAICQVFSVPEQVALHDVTEAVRKLEEAGLVVWSHQDGVDA